MAVIYIKDLVIEATHGVHQLEKIKAQRFKLAVELTVDTTKATVLDDIEETVNWSVVRDKIVDTVENSTFNLVEKLARAVAERLLEDQRIEKVIVSVDKLDALPSGVPGVRLELSN